MSVTKSKHISNEQAPIVVSSRLLLAIILLASNCSLSSSSPIDKPPALDSTRNRQDQSDWTPVNTTPDSGECVDLGQLNELLNELPKDFKTQLHSRLDELADQATIEFARMASGRTRRESRVNPKAQSEAGLADDDDDDDENETAEEQTGDQQQNLAEAHKRSASKRPAENSSESVALESSLNARTDRRQVHLEPQTSEQDEQERAEADEADQVNKQALAEQQQQQQNIIQEHVAREAKMIDEQRRQLVQQQELLLARNTLGGKRAERSDFLVANHSEPLELGSLIGQGQRMGLLREVSSKSSLPMASAHDLLEVPAELKPAHRDMLTAAQHHYGSHYGSLHGHHQDYYQFAESHKKGQFHSGFKRGGAKFHISGHASQHKSHAEGHVKWHGKKGKGSQYWDFKHKDKKHYGGHHYY